MNRNRERFFLIGFAMRHSLDEGSIELVVVGLLAALIVVLAIPLFSGIDEPAPQQLPSQQQEQQQ